MLSFVGRRVGQLVLVLWAISTLLFVLLRSSGDPVVMLAGETATPEVIASIRHQMGFDQPLYIQYWRFLEGAVTLHFGDSISAKTDAMTLVLARLPATLALTGAALLVALVLAVPIGVYAAVRRGGWGSTVAMGFAFLGQAMPVFWLGILLILIFGVHFRWLPTFGTGDLKHLVLPAITLAAALLAKLVRLVRSGMIEILSLDYIRTARSKGLGARTVVFSHALRNALIPFVTVVGVDIGQLLGGAVITETIFSWPGIGRQMLQAVSGRDYPLVQATVFVIAIMVVVVNLLVDLTYRMLDPRIRLI